MKFEPSRFSPRIGRLFRVACSLPSRATSSSGPAPSPQATPGGYACPTQRRTTPGCLDSCTPVHARPAPAGLSLNMAWTGSEQGAGHRRQPAPTPGHPRHLPQCGPRQLEGVGLGSVPPSPHAATPRTYGDSACMQTDILRIFQNSLYWLLPPGPSLNTPSLPPERPTRSVLAFGIPRCRRGLARPPASSGGAA